jgi:riboflavin kinase / FMN adenylyltransferase
MPANDPSATSDSGHPAVLSLDEIARVEGPLHLALGVFDGVHVGHQAVIARAVAAARRDGGRAGVLTFDPHPIRVIAPAKAPAALLSTLRHKADIVARLGAPLLLPLRFDEELARLGAADFVAALMMADIRTLAVGEDWRFGHHRAGDVDLLREKSAEFGFHLEAVAPVMLDGDRISSTRIRQAIRDGNLEDAARMLGRPFSVTGRVVEGRKLGREIGFPTANIAAGDAQLPPDGVWTIRADIGQGRNFRGIANLGVRPTVDGVTRLLEAHLFDFDGDLYGREIEIIFGRMLRHEMKFDSVDALREQIARDAAAARADE